jgi:hypothetical protein
MLLTPTTGVAGVGDDGGDGMISGKKSNSESIIDV